MLQTPVPALLALTLCLLCGRGVAGQEQRVFTVEGRSVVRPIAIPGGIARLLEDDPGVRPILESSGLRRLPAAWVVVSKVRLSSSGPACFLVVGQGPLLGANTARFWLLAKGANEEYNLLLSTLALRLEILLSAAHGYRDIQTAAAFADRVVTLTWRFDGRAYRVKERKTRTAR